MSEITFWAIIVAADYIAAGVMAYGISLAYWQRRFSTIAKSTSEKWADRAMAMFMACLGWYGFLMAIILARPWRYGLAWRPITEEDRQYWIRREHPEYAKLTERIAQLDREIT